MLTKMTETTKHPPTNLSRYGWLSIATAVVTIGSTVTVQEDGFEPETYLIVGAAEADPGAGYISNESPLGRMLIGQTVGADLNIMSPDGLITYKLLTIS